MRGCEGARVTTMMVWGWIRCGCGECMICVWCTWFRYCWHYCAMDECGAWDEMSWLSM